MAENHELNLTINATPAEAGARKFTAAIAAVKAAVQDLDKDSTGAFTKLQAIKPQIDTSGLTKAVQETDKLTTSSKTADAAATVMANKIKSTAIASANALRVSTDQAARLRERLLGVGDSAGLDRLNSGLLNLKSNLTTASTGLDVRAARAGYADLASELNRSARESERLRAVANATARANEDAARAAQTHATQLDGLRSKYNPLYASSKAYETALEEISFAEREGAISAQLAADARQRAAQQLAGATSAVDMNTAAMKRNSATTQQGVLVGHQLSDVLITSQMGFQSVGMIALQQGSQLAAQMNGLKASGGSVFKTLLSGVSSLVNPLSLTTIGVVAVGSAVAKWFFAAGEDTKSFSDALSDANSNISNLRSATDAAGGTLSDLKRQYGAVNDELDAHLERLRKIAAIQAASSNVDMIAGIRDALTSDGNLFTNDVDAVRRAFDTTNDGARSLLALMQDVQNARTFEQQADSVTRLRTAVESTTGGLGNAKDGAKGVLVQLVQAEDAALRLLAAQNGVTGATDTASGSASSLTFTIGTAADEAGRLLANLNSVPSAIFTMGNSVQSQISTLQAQNSALNLQIDEGISGIAANRRVQLETMITNAGERGQTLNVDQIAAEWQAIGELDAAAQEQERLRKKLSEQNAPERSASRSGGGGSSRAAELSDEQKATKALTDALQDRANALKAERIEMQLLAEGHFETADAASLFAQAMATGGGTVDTTTAAMIRQIDAASTLNDELSKLANDPVKEWMDAIPSWLEAGREIEMGAIGSVQDALSQFMQTGKHTKAAWEDLGNTILGVVSDVVAEKAVADTLGLMGREENVGFGGFLEGALGVPTSETASGGISAGQSISEAMINAGSQVSQQIAAAMTQAGQTSAVSQQNAITTAGTTAASQQRLAGVQTGAQISSATTTSGQQHALNVRTAITTAGAQHAAQVGAATSGGAGGIGGMFAGAGEGVGMIEGLGGWGGIATLAAGFFSEGGVSTSPVSMGSAPASAFQHAPHFSTGTANTSGIPAVLHPNEAVIPLSGGRKIPVDMGDQSNANSNTVNFSPIYNIQTPNADSFRKSGKQIAADGYTAARRAAEKQR